MGWAGRACARRRRSGGGHREGTAAGCRGRGCAGRRAAVLEYLAGFDGRVIAVYEAGPTDVGGARDAIARGRIDMRVCAPGRSRASRPIASDRSSATPRSAGAPARRRRPVVRSRPQRGRRGAARPRSRSRGRPSGPDSRARHRLSKMLAASRVAATRRARRGPISQHLHWISPVEASTTWRSPEWSVGEYVQRRPAAPPARRKDLEATIERSCCPTAPLAQTAYAHLRCFRGLATLSARSACAAEVGDFPSLRQALAAGGVPGDRPGRIHH